MRSSAGAVGGLGSGAGGGLGSGAGGGLGSGAGGGLRCGAGARLRSRAVPMSAGQWKRGHWRVNLRGGGGAYQFIYQLVKMYFLF